VKRLTTIDRWAGQGSGFNRGAAEVVYKALTEMDPGTALVYGRLLVAGGLQHDLIAHRAELEDVTGQIVAKRAEELRATYARSAVSKRRAGEDDTEDLRMLAYISKAGFGHLTTDERSRYASNQRRGNDGRFVQDHRKIDTDPSRSPDDQDMAARTAGVPKSALKGADLAHYQQAYGQIRDLLAPFHSPDLGSVLHLTVAQRNGQVREKQIPVGNKTEIKEIQANLQDGDRIETAAVSIQRPNPDVMPPSYAAADILSAAGAPRLGGYVADAYGGVLNRDKLHTFSESRLKDSDNDAFSGTSRAFNRVREGSKLLQDSLGPDAPQQLTHALAVANHIGQYGPEAQKVFGPFADRVAYRYRGTERTPDPRLIHAFRVLATGGTAPGDPAGGRRGVALRDAAVQGIDGPDGWYPGAVLRYFKDQLPDPDLNELQRKSGVIPPSEGIIIARDGKIAHQAVGYADDWYLPFNLKHLSALKGGEYIRTRTFGGPTTEDIYTGLVSGARSMTVVSHNGVYNIDFDQNLRGGRRFNDKAGRMVARYGQLLDAVRSKQVSRGGITSSRMAELREEAKRYEPDETRPGFDQRLTQLKTDERRNPKLSQQETDAVSLTWLDEYAAKQKTRDGHVMSGDQLVADIIDTRAKEMFRVDKERAAGVGQQPHSTLEAYRAQAARDFQKPNPADQVRAVAEAKGVSASLDGAVRRATEANRRRSGSLQLDGNGYDAALNALQEQFPYYIRARYTPWRNAIGGGSDRTLEGQKDTGYVAPRHNRPEEAESGYFNSRVNGQGKVRASSTRYQNYAVNRGNLRPVTPSSPAAAAATGPLTATPAGRAGTDDAVASLKDRPVVGRSAWATARAAAAASNPTAAATPAAGPNAARRQADLDLLDEFLAQRTFKAGASLPDGAGGQNSLDNHDIRREVQIPGFPHEAMKAVYTTPRAALEAMPADDLHDLLDELTNMPEREALFALPPRKVALFNNGGKPLVAQPIPSGITEMLRELDEDHSFPNAGIAYDAARMPTLKNVEDAYGTEPMISALVDAGELPGVDNADFEKKIAPLVIRLKAASDEHRRVEGMGGRVDPIAAHRLNREAEGLLRATQLRRRWKEADARRPAPTPIPSGPDLPANTHTDEIVVVNADDDIVTQLLRRIPSRSDGTG
jgi:hypothetical protein